MKKKIYNLAIIIPLFATAIKMLFVPVTVSGGIAGINETGYAFILGHIDGCERHVDGFCSHAQYGQYAIEAVATFFVTLAITAIGLAIYTKVSPNSKQGKK